MRKITLLKTTTADIATSSLVSRRNKFSSGFKFFSILLFILLVSGKSWGQATLPLNRTAWASEPTGWTNSGCTQRITTFACSGSDASTFDTNGDYRIVYFSSTPSQLTFKLKKSSMSGESKLVIYESSDGSIYSVNATYGTATGATAITDCGDVTLTLNSSTRYVKWTYTKATGNCDIDDVSISAGSSSTPTKLAITSITPTTPTAGSTFSVTVQAQDGSSLASNVSGATGFDLSTNGNAGTIGGTTTGTILSGTSSITVTGVTLSSAGTGATITATRSSGDVLTAGTSSTFNVLATAPTVASAVTVGSKTATTVPLSWTSGNGAARIVVARLNATTAVAPTAGTDYTTNSTDFTDALSSLTGTGNRVVYNGTGNSVTVTGLTAATAYNFDVYEYNGSTSTSNYSAAASAGSTTTFATEPSTQATTLTFTSVSATGMTIGWTNPVSGGGTNRIVVVKATSTVNSDPVDGTAYTASTTFTSGTQIGTGNYVVYNSTSNSVVVTGLTSNTTYYVAVYEFNGSTTTINYLTASPLTGNKVTLPTVASAVSITARTTTTMDLSWTSGTGTGRIVVARPSTATLVAATAGTSYTVNSNSYSDATNGITGTGNVVVYNGTGNTTTVTGLSPAVQYTYYVYEYNSATAYAAAATSSATYTYAAEPTTQASAVVFSNVTATTMTIGFTKGDIANTGRIVLVRAGGAVNSDPVDGTTYTANTTFGSGTQVGTGNYVVYANTGASVAITGLTANTTYYVAVYEYNSTGAPSNFLTTTPATGSQVTTKSSAATDYFRSKASNDWSNVASWESSANGSSNWLSADATPTSTATAVSIENGHEITVAASATSSNLTVQAGGKLTINPTYTLAVIGNLTIESSASGTGTIKDNGTLTVSGTTSVKQYLTGGRNWYISSPVTGETAADVLNSSTASTKPSSFVLYDETKGSTTPWTPTSSTLTVTKGYIAVSDVTTPSTDGVITFTGTLNTGDYSTGPTLNPLTLSSTGVKDGFNLVGNPYPSYVDWNQATKTGIDGTMWYRTYDGSAWKFYTYNTVDGAGGIGVPASVTNLIPPMQAFWVKVTNATNTLGFTNTSRSHKVDASVFRAPAAKTSVNQILRLQVSAGSITDEAVVYFNPNAANSYDAYDSPKMMNGTTSIVPDIYTIAGTEQLVINGMNTIPYDVEIPLYFNANASSAGPFSLSSPEMSNFETGTKVYVKNNKTGEQQIISDGTVYSFDASAVGSDPAFSLIFKAPGAITAIPTAANDANLLVYRNANNQIAVQIKGQLKDAYSLDVYNSTGQKLVSKQATAGITIMDAPQSGVYFVTIKGNGNNTTKKVVIN